MSHLFNGVLINILNYLLTNNIQEVCIHQGLRASAIRNSICCEQIKILKLNATA